MKLDTKMSGAMIDALVDGQRLSSPAPALRSSTPLIAVRELRSSDTQGSKGAGGRVVVGSGPRMVIASADAGWLRLFGFSAGEVVKRSSLKICCGPKTKIDTTESLVDRTAGAAPTWITLYEKNGSEVVVVVRATRVEEGDDDAKPQFALEMQSVDWLSGGGERGGKTEEETAEELTDDTASTSSKGSCTGSSADRDSSFSASFSALKVLPEPTTIKKGSRAHLKSFLAAGRTRNLAEEVGAEGKRFSRVRREQCEKREKDEDVSS
jgi:hypothetical protein